jgi:MATE family multidrug resistance protein
MTKTLTFVGRMKRILRLMVPILITQLAINGMNLSDTIMSGHAGTADLAGVAIGVNIWMPVFTGLNGILQALTPIVANYRGAGTFHKISGAVFSGLVLAFCLACTIILIGLWKLDAVLRIMDLAPEVHLISYHYLGYVALGIIPLFGAGILRCFVDTMGYTQVTMRIFLLTMPVNCFLNYLFIFGKLGLPRMGGAGAGVGTALTCWLLFFSFVFLVIRLSVFQKFHVFNPSGFSFHHLHEHLRVGIPMGISIFLETSIFGVECLFVSRFGTVAVAANQAAMSFTNLLYMVPLSFSLALTILIGAFVGARDYESAQIYAKTGRIANLLTGFFFALFLFLGRPLIARLYTQDPGLLQPIQHFLFFAVCFQFCDSTAAPIQGILRGYKDVKATFYSALMAYWVIALPFGLVMDHVFHQGPDGYWMGLIMGIFFSAFFLTLRLRYIEKTTCQAVKL